MSAVLTLPHEIQNKVLRTIIDSIIETACVNPPPMPRRELYLYTSRIALQILDLRHISKHAAREVMFVCWKRLERILLINAWERPMTIALYREELVLAKCVCGWLRTSPDDDFLLTKARQVVSETQLSMGVRALK